MSDEPIGFEQIYQSVGDDLDQLPWANLAPHTDLVAWLDDASPTPARALVIGCGLGDDAAELARRGFEVTAFDLSATAIGWAQRRYADLAGTISFEVRDLFDLPAVWDGAFDLVVEIHTIQSLPRDVRPEVVEIITSKVAPGGALFVRCFVVDDQSQITGRPWALAPDDVALLARDLTQASEKRSQVDGRDWLTAAYYRAT